MRTSRMRRGISLAAVVALGLVVLAGCGSSSNKSNTKKSSTTAAAGASTSSSSSAVPAATQAYYTANVKTPTNPGIIGGPLTKEAAHRPEDRLPGVSAAHL